MVFEKWEFRMMVWVFYLAEGVVNWVGDGGVWVTIPGSCFLDGGGKKKVGDCKGISKGTGSTFVWDLF